MKREDIDRAYSLNNNLKDFDLIIQRCKNSRYNEFTFTDGNNIRCVDNYLTEDQKAIL